MVAKELAKIVSDISKKELGLLYYSPAELEEIINENRAIVFEENGKLSAFGSWTFHGDWVEVHTLYISPEFRGQGYLRKLFSGIYERLKEVKSRAFFFTQSPAVAHVAEEFQFKPALYSNLPAGILFRLILHRSQPRRWIYYSKYLKLLSGLLRFKVFIRA